MMAYQNNYNNGYYNNPSYYQQPNYYNGAMPDILSQQKMQYQQPIQTQPMQQPAPPMNDMLWVQGEAGAKAYLVAPNNTVTLWDSESQTIYLKSADASGMPSMRILDFTERTANTPKTPSEHVCKCGDKFVTKEQFEALQSKYDELMTMIEEIKSKPTSKNTKTTKESAE